MNDARLKAPQAACAESENRAASGRAGQIEFPRTTGARLLSTMLFQVKPNDPLVYGAVAVLLGLVSVVASYVPARRASRIDPLAAIRQE